jgi:hypothetical protein
MAPMPPTFTSLSISDCIINFIKNYKLILSQYFLDKKYYLGKISES